MEYQINTDRIRQDKSVLYYRKHNVKKIISHVSISVTDLGEPVLKEEDWKMAK